MQTIEGPMLAQPGDSFAIVVSRFNDLVTGRLLEGAISTLKRHGASVDRVTAVWVPGAFELPLVAGRLAATKKYAAVIALGAVIQGNTTHHEYINHATAQGLMRAGQDTGVPVLFGVLTCESMEQALDRAGGKVGNKGAEAALAAIETVSVLRQIGTSS
ncbi:MAG: 6,7-dimethyl-8-ribityllumazine synthase [Planctomycetota bacterium]|nr:MAG: 6,7-dimethyl-8-ribityllumazine synthase [Planctomycetota bacterium]